MELLDYVKKYRLPQDILDYHFTLEFDKWTHHHDRALFRLMSYINQSVDLLQTQVVGDQLEDIHVSIFADADFATMGELLLCLPFQ